MARKEKKYHFIYKTTNTITGRYYYGMHSTNNLDDGYLGSGKRLRYSINKYGQKNHQVKILEFCSDRNSLKQREKELITLNEIAKVNCMNLKIGGDGGFISKEQQKYRSSCGGRTFAKKLISDEDFRERFRNIQSIRRKEAWKSGLYKNTNHATFLNKKHTEKTKQKMSESHKGKGIGSNNSQYNTCWVTNEFTNKKIGLNELNIYLNNGWRRGRIIN